MDNVFGFDSSDDSVILGTDYQINDEVHSSDSQPSVYGLHFPHQIVRNKTLFGDVEIPTESGYFDMVYAITASTVSLVDGTMAKEASSWYNKATDTLSERAIKLEVSSHRGHNKNNPNDVPKCLLQQGTNQYYQSLVNDQQNPKKKDWIIFKIKGKKLVIPTKIVIRNRDSKWGIKTIIVSGSSDNIHFEKWCKIENIQKRSDKLQIFTVDAVSAHFAFLRHFKYFRINITENYSGGTNVFYEFRIHGVYSAEGVSTIEQKTNREQNDFISALAVDQYGFVFVDDTLSEAYPFMIGQKVQYNGLVGNICRMTTDEICVKTRSDGMIEFGWIERLAAPKKITSVFEHQEDLDDYEFTATVNQRDISVDFSTKKKHSFSEMNQFMIPLREMLIENSDVFPIDIYAKPKNSKSQWNRIKSIDYSFTTSDVVDHLENPALDDLLMTLKERKMEIKNSALITSLPLNIWSNLTKHPDLFEETAYRRKFVIERLIVEICHLKPDCVRWILDQNKGDKPLLQWLVEDRKVYRLFPHYQATMSGFKVCYKSVLLNRFWLKFERCTKMTEIFNVDSSEDSVVAGTEYDLNGMVYPLENTPVFAEMPHQMMRNEKLFGRMGDFAISVEGDQDITASVFALVDEASGFDVESWFGSVTKKGKEQPIKLQIESHREHWEEGKRSPQNLLEKGTESYYHSQNKRGPASEDWIVFKVKQEVCVVPTKLVIRNSTKKIDKDRAIKTISISGSADNKHFKKWCKIENIANRKDNLQNFIVDPVSAHFAFMRGFRYYRIDMVENYGDKNYNIFYEFGIHGVYMDVLTTDFVQNVNIDQNGVISWSVGDGATVFVPRDSARIQGRVCQTTKDQFCIEFRSDNMIEREWCDKEKIHIEGGHQISEYIFAAGAGSKEDEDNAMGLTEFTFDDVNGFEIPSRVLVARSSSPDAVHIYAKPRAEAVDFHRIKTMQYEFESYFFSRYFVDQKEIFVINKTIKVDPFTESQQRGGCFQLMTSSKVMISSEGGINADQCGLKMNAKHLNRSTLKFGEYIGRQDDGDDVHSVSKTVGSGGGVICLIADDCVVNEGSIACRGTETSHFSGGSVHIITDELFRNGGHIDAGQGGCINIRCSRFVNEGHITPIPNVVIGVSKLINVSSCNLSEREMDELNQLVDVCVSGRISRGEISTSEEWNYTGGTKRDAICVKVNQDCYLIGIGVFDCKQKMEIECRIYEGDNGSNAGPVIRAEPKKIFEFGERSDIPFELQFKSPAMFRKNEKYTIEILQKNHVGKSRRTVKGQEKVEWGQFAVTFFKAKSSPNGTNVSIGAFPYLCFSQ